MAHWPQRRGCKLLLAKVRMPIGRIGIFSMSFVEISLSLDPLEVRYSILCWIWLDNIKMTQELYIIGMKLICINGTFWKEVYTQCTGKWSQCQPPSINTQIQMAFQQFISIIIFVNSTTKSK